ncbi:MAG: hypothetical protein EBU90_10240 [Proteobacteria bacterium]|nr:hypothetical protein [Pseudomonadota bacterium]NBP13788.1 hypothetical protein [bacterium]
MGNLTSTPTTTGITQTQADGLYQTRGNYALSSQYTTLDNTVGSLRTTIAGVDTRVTGVNAALSNRITGVDNIVSGIDTRVSGIDTRVSGIDTRVTGINTSIGNLASSFNSFSPAIATTIGSLIASNPQITGLNTNVQTLLTGFNGINNTIGALITSVGNLSAAIGSPLAQRTIWCATGEFCPLPAGKGMQIGEYTVGVNNNRLCVRRGTGTLYCFDGTNLSAATSGSTVGP